MRTILEVLGWLTAVFIFALAGHAVFAQSSAQEPPVQQQTRERRLTRREEREDLTPASLLRDARTIYISPSRHLDKKYLEYKLQKYRELQDWNLMLVTDEQAADLVVSFDKTALNYIFHITDARSGVIVTSGKTVAVNKLVAAENLGGEIVKKMRDLRAAPERRTKKKKRDADDDDEWSESR